MRCDHLTPVIFRASGSKFASWSAPRRARFHTRPPAGTSAAKRAACCLPARRDRGISKHPLQPPESPHTAASPLPPCRSLTDRASAHLCPDTLHNAHASPLYSSITTAPQIRPPQLHHRPKTLRSSRPSPTHSTTKSPIVLSSSPQPPANPNLHALQLLHTPAQPPLNLAPSSPLPCPSLLSQILISHHQSPPSLISPLTPHLPSAPPLNPLSEPKPKPHHQPPPPPKYSKTHIKPDTSLALRDEE